ncbi:MAG: hypothetical protein KGQ51_01265 [Planctomycetes bacterium]|nr:hypothetical protein [Planctomycetota bacterium]
MIGRLQASKSWWVCCAVAIVQISLTTGCTTHAKRIAIPRTHFYDGQFTVCREQLEKIAKNHRQDRDVANLDLAMVDLLEGQTERAERRLREVRDRFDHLEQASLTEKTISMWTDDSVRAYAGEDYEKILLRVFLALASLMRDGTDAESYTLQIQDKHDEIRQRLGQSEIDNAATSNRFGLPIGFYLRGMLREQTHQNYDDALRAYSQAASILPECVPLQWDMARVQQGVHSKPGCGVVIVFAMVGRGPYKIEVNERPTSDALLIADRIISAVGPYQLPPTIAPIKVPDITVPPGDVDSVFVSVEGQQVGPTVSLANVEQLAETTYRSQRDQIVARAVARRVVKKATVVTAKNSIGANDLTGLGMDLAGVAWEATETADTRCWGLLPRDIQILRVEVPSGDHSLQVSPMFGNYLHGVPRAVDVHVDDGRNSYVLCWFPDSQTAGRVLASHVRSR